MKKDNSLDKFVEKYPTYIEALDIIDDLEKQLTEKDKRLKEIDDWKYNYGYTNYDDIYMLEDLQSRAFQSEDDTTVVNELLDYLNISDENEILPTIKQQLAEKDKEIETKNIVNNLYKTTVSLRDNDFKDLVYENNSLKQQLKSQPAEIVEKIGGEIYTRMVVECKETKYTDINLILDTILKEYQK